jgi:hypothetical protein
MTTTVRSLLHHRCLKGATPMVRFRLPTGISTSSLVVVKQPRATDSSDQTQGRLTSQYRIATTSALVRVINHFL